MNRIAEHSLMANPNIGHDVFHDVTDVKISVCVRKRGRQENGAFTHEYFFHMLKKTKRQF